MNGSGRFRSSSAARGPRTAATASSWKTRWRSSSRRQNPSCGRLTSISPWFLQEMEEIVVMEGRLRGFPLERLPRELLEKAKRAGFTDTQIASFCGAAEGDVAARRSITPASPGNSAAAG